MWEKLSPPWQASVEQAWEAYCAGSVPIGAVITDRDGRTLSRGRNRLFENSNGDGKSIARVPLAHAEINALLNLDYAAVDPHDCVLYTTTEPCPLCIGALCLANIRRLHYASRDPWCGSVDLLQASHYMNSKQIQVKGPEQTDFETVLVAIQSEHQLRRGDKRALPVVARWKAVLPQGVSLGERLLESGFLQQMRLSGARVSDVLNDLGQMARDLT
jgi:tRNA(adenine34) deaminase